eukprot:COSAG04_NODE_2330_length_4324_cov_2.131124_6_plen_417_part_00
MSSKKAAKKRGQERRKEPETVQQGSALRLHTTALDRRMERLFASAWLFASAGLEDEQVGAAGQQGRSAPPRVELLGLLAAAARGACGAVGRLLHSGLDVNAMAEDGSTCHPLVTGQPVRLLALLEAAAGGDAVQPSTGFHLACFKNIPECAEALVRAGCDTSRRGANARLQLREAESAQARACSATTEIGRAGKTTQATALGMASVRLLPDRWADPSLARSDGITPLMAAADSLPLLRPLIESADSADESTTFHYVCDLGNVDCAEALVRASCDTSIRTASGETGRDVAQRQSHTAVDRTSLRAKDRGAAGARRNPTKGALASAVGSSLPLLRLLLEAKELEACFKSHPDSAEALVRAGCDTSLRASNGMTRRDDARAQNSRTAAIIPTWLALARARQGDPPPPPARPPRAIPHSA